eukprot:maker-scaffold74_size411160-snap-gene-3.20 protein:Tk04227 transcript:maker-scaffold74_size411160-snap-gene-3.20-mRNA-1 annotation:"hypothetical protein CAPTEDRAFT_213494"
MPSKLEEFILSVDPVYCYVVFWIYRTALRLVNGLSEKLFDYSLFDGLLTSEPKSASFDQSAHLVRVVGRGALSFGAQHTLDNFVWIHQDYIHPRYILENECVTFHGVDEHHVWFCVSKKVDVADLSKSPFAFTLQFFAAEELIIMKHVDVHRLASEMGPIGPDKAYLITGTARCGSTLLSQMLAQAPNVKSYSEPWGLLHLSGLKQQSLITDKEYEDLTRSLTRLQFKDVLTSDQVVIKLPFLANPIVPMVKKVCPEVKHVFNSRCPKPSINSFWKLVQPSMNTYYFKYKGRDFWFRHSAIYQSNNYYRQLYQEQYQRRWDFDNAECQVTAYCGALNSYLQNKDSYDHVILYEDITDDLEGTAERLLKFMNLPISHRDKLLEASKSDSQNGIFKTSQKLANLTDEEW